MKLVKGPAPPKALILTLLMFVVLGPHRSSSQLTKCHVCEEGRGGGTIGSTRYENCIQGGVPKEVKAGLQLQVSCATGKSCGWSKEYKSGGDYLVVQKGCFASDYVKCLQDELKQTGKGSCASGDYFKVSSLCLDKQRSGSAQPEATKDSARQQGGELFLEVCICEGDLCNNNNVEAGSGDGSDSGGTSSSTSMGRNILSTGTTGLMMTLLPIMATLALDLFLELLR